MYNFFTYNGVASKKLPNIQGKKTIRFGDFFLHGLPGISVTALEFLNWKTINVQSESFANDGEHFNRREVLQRIRIGGSIRKESRAELLDFIDNFKAVISKEKQYLTITEWDWSRRIRATVTQYDLKEERYTVNWIEFSILLESFKYWEESEVTEILQENISTSAHEYWVARDGTAEARMTTIISFTSASGVTEIDFSGVKILWSIISWDNIIIDWENQRVIKNGIQVGFSWVIPLLKKQNNQLKLYHNGTAVYNITTQYRLTYK